MPPTIYSYLTYSACRQELANRLYDPTKQFWRDQELGVYLREALRTWNAITSYWKAEFTFQSQSSVSWMDLTDTTAMPNTLRPFTVQDIDLYSLIQYHLLEPISWNPWQNPSAQFTVADIIGALQRRLNEILSTTGCTVTRRLVPATPGRIILPDTVFDIRRVSYLPAIGSPSTMWPEDTWAEQSYNAGYLQQPAGTPSTFIQTTQPPISFDPDRNPGSAGSYGVLTIESGPTLTEGTPSTLPIPNDWTHVLAWGTLADLFSRESNAKDPLRAKYCEQRYRMGLSILSEAPALLAMRLGNVILQVDSVRSADLYNASWESQPATTPVETLQSGLNLIALAPKPSAGPFSLTASVVQNAPVPVNDNDFVQVGRDDLDVILDYAQHLAALKMGGAEFLSTMPLFNRFMAQASIYGLKLSEIGEYMSVILNLSGTDDSMNPRMQPAPEAS